MYQKEPQGSIFPGHPGAESYPNSWKKQWLKKLSQHYPPPSLPTATTSSQDHSYSRPTPRIPGQNSDNPQPHFPNTHRKTTTLSLLYSSYTPRTPPRPPRSLGRIPITPNPISPTLTGKLPPCPFPILPAGLLDAVSL